MYKTAVHLQCRVFLIPVVKKNIGVISCSKGRDYSSSFPLRYIPKKSPKSEESEASCPPTNHYHYTKKHDTLDSDVERVKLFNSAQPSSSGRSFLQESKFRNQNEKLNGHINYGVGMGVGEEFDGGMLFEGNEYMEEPEDNIEEPDVSSEKERRGSPGIQGCRKQEVEKMAVELLATRAFTAVELRKKLLGKKCPQVVVDAVIAEFQCRGLINDGLYAEAFSRSRWSSSTWGPRRIKKALFSKGVSNEDAEKAVKLVFSDAEANGDEETGLGMSKISMDHLFEQASKQWLRSHDVSRETRKSRIVRWLQYRGFSWSIISVVMKKLESKHPP